jgi:mono/diheme cytochrome c family protein
MVHAVTGCSVCHVLAAAGASGEVARPDLGTTRSSYAKTVGAIANGIQTTHGAAMAPFKTALDATQIRDVSTFIHRAEHAHG